MGDAKGVNRDGALVDAKYLTLWIASLPPPPSVSCVSGLWHNIFTMVLFSLGFSHSLTAGD